MINYANRIKYLREKVGKSEEEICTVLNITSMSLYDLETYKDELLSVLSLNQVLKLANLFNIPSLQLFTEIESDSQINHLEYNELIKSIHQYCEIEKKSIEILENEVGWSLDALFESQEKFLNSYDVSFLVEIGNSLNINWLTLIPNNIHVT